MKRILVMAVLACAMAAFLPAEGGKESAKATGSAAVVNPSGYPIVKQPITLQGFTFMSGQQQDFNKMELTAKLEKLTGIKVEWNSPINTDAQQKLNLLFAGGTYPDFCYRIGPSNFLQYCVDGVVVRLDGYVGTYAPDLMKLYAAYPEVEMSAKEYDGHLYGLPAKEAFGPVKSARYPLVSTVWLAKVGKKPPATSDELLSLLRAFKAAGDIDGDGKADNQWPLAAHNEGLLMMGFAGMFGLKNYTGIGTARSVTVWNSYENGKFSFMISGNEFRDMLRYAALLYKEGLIEPDIVTHDDKTYFGRLADGKYGMVWQYNPTALQSYQKDFVVFPPPKGPKGEQKWMFSGAQGFSKNNFFITKPNKYPEASIRWYNYFYTYEGSESVYLLEVPKYFVKKGDAYEPTDLLKNMPEGVFNFLGKNTYFHGAGPIGWVRNEHEAAIYFPGNPMVPFVAAVEPYLNPAFVLVTFSPEEGQQVSAISTDLFQQFAKFQAQFITGALDVNNNADWEKYVKALESFRIGELEKLYTTVINRQTKK